MVAICSSSRLSSGDEMIFLEIHYAAGVGAPASHPHARAGERPRVRRRHRSCSSRQCPKPTKRERLGSPRRVETSCPDMTTPICRRSQAVGSSGSGKSTSRKTYRTAPCELIAYVVKGKVKSTVGSEEFIMGSGDVCRHPKGVLHGLEAIEDFVVVEIKSPAPEIGAFFAMRKRGPAAPMSSLNRTFSC